MNDQPTLTVVSSTSAPDGGGSTSVDGSRRHTVQKFAAFIAHLFNGSDQDSDIVVLNYGEIYQKLTRLLEVNASYRNDVAGGRYCNADAWGEANALTNFYFDRILDRPLGINRGKKSSVTFDLLVSMLQRCASEAVSCAELKPHLDGDGGGNVTSMDPDVRELISNVGALLARPHGDETDATTAYDDPPTLKLNSHALPLPQTLSMWQAATAAPRRVRQLQKGPEFLGFCSKMINAVETANRPCLELLNVGLCPGDWLDEVPLNQLRAIGRLVRHVLNQSEDEVSLAEASPDMWQLAWDNEPVPRFDTVEAFLASPMAQALTGKTTAMVFENELPEDDLLEQDGEDADPESQMLSSPDEFARLLALARGAGVIDEREENVMIALFQGEDLATLSDHPEYASMIGKQQRKVERFITELQEKLLEFARRQQSV
jgi:hypothetical protein